MSSGRHEHHAPRMSGRSQSAAAPLLRGREQQWPLLLRSLDAARSDPRRGCVLLVEGPTGAGLSSLLDETAQAAAKRAFSIARAAADEVRRAVPLAILNTALGNSFDSGPPGAEPGAVGDHDAAWRIDRLRVRVRERLRSGPLLVALDDLHWADDTTLAALRGLVADFAGQPVVWLLARRTGAPGSTAERTFAVLRREKRAVPLTLDPLSDRAVAELAADRLSAEPDAALLAYAEGAGGNPAALVALLDGLVEEGWVRTADGLAQLHGDALSGRPPRRFTALVRGTLAPLGPHCRLLLDVAGVLGRTFVPEDVSQMLGRPTATVLPALHEALRARIVICEGDAVAFRHELVRQAVLTTIPWPLRGALHRQAAEILLGRGDMLPAAAHLLHSARRGNRRAAEVMCSAAAEVTATEPRRAVELSLRALQIVDGGDPLRAELLRVAVEALTRCGPLRHAVELAQEALAEPLPPAHLTVLRYGLASALLLSGRTEEAVSVAEQALCLPVVASAADLRQRAVLARLHGKATPDAAAAGHEGRQEVAWQGGDAPAGLLIVQAESQWQVGRVGEALRLARAAVGASGRGGADWPFPPRLTLAAMLTRLRAAAEAGALLDRLTHDIHAEGWPVLRSAVLILEASLALARATSEEAAAKAAAGLAAADEAGLPRFAPLGWQVLVEAALRRGDLAAADGHVRRLTEAVTGGGPAGGPGAVTHIVVAWSTAQLGAARHDAAALDAALAAIRADREGLPRLLVGEPAAAAWLVRTALARGDGELAARTVAAAERLAAGNPDVPSLLAAARHASGVHRQDPEVLRQAADLHQDLWSRASAAEDLGTLPDQDRAWSVAELDRALAGYSRLGAERDAARVRRRLRHIGVRRRHWTQAERPASGWASLTETERRVAELVAQGLTNRQVAAQMFLSPHTIGFHLRQIFRKLQVQSRIGLARMYPGTGDGSLGTT